MQSRELSAWPKKPPANWNRDRTIRGHAGSCRAVAAIFHPPSLQLDETAVLAGLKPAEDSAHFAAPSAGAAGTVDFVAMAVEPAEPAGTAEPMTADGGMGADGASSGSEDGGSDAMDDTDGPPPSAISRQPKCARPNQLAMLCRLDKVDT